MAERAFQVLPNTANAQDAANHAVSALRLFTLQGVHPEHQVSRPSRFEAHAHDDLTQKETTHARAERSDRSVRNERRRQGGGSHDAADRQGSGAASRHEPSRAAQVGRRAASSAVRGARRSQELLSQHAAGGAAGSMVRAASMSCRPLLQGGAAVAREPHKLQVSGSNPLLASKEGGDHAPTPPKAGPLHQESGGLNTPNLSVDVAHGGLFGLREKWVAGGRAVGAALTPPALRTGDVAQLGERRIPNSEDVSSTLAGPATSTDEQVTKSAEHLGSAPRLAPVSKCLTESPDEQKLQGQPGSFFSPGFEQMCGAARSRAEAPRVATVRRRAA